MKENDFIKQLKELNINISILQLKKLRKYYELLIKWNKTINLTTITEEEKVYLKHFYDSLTLTLIYNFDKNIRVCDVGTGAGFPGIVLKIFFPKIKITLIDSSSKKIKFLQQVIKSLKLKKVTLINERVENYCLYKREKYDVVITRAVGKLNIISELSIPLVKQKGFFIVMKSNITEELRQAKKSLSILGCEVSIIIFFFLPIERSKRVLVKIKKNKKTNLKYPRNFKKIKKKPL